MEVAHPSPTPSFALRSAAGARSGSYPTARNRPTCSQRDCRQRARPAVDVTRYSGRMSTASHSPSVASCSRIVVGSVKSCCRQESSPGASASASPASGIGGQVDRRTQGRFSVSIRPNRLERSGYLGVPRHRRATVTAIVGSAESPPIGSPPRYADSMSGTPRRPTAVPGMAPSSQTRATIH